MEWRPAILLLAATPLAGCAGEGQTFVVGWVFLGLLIAFMLVLFGGLIRYIRQGRKPQRTPAVAPHFEYEQTDEDEYDEKL
jgi:hypothetical protein